MLGEFFADTLLEAPCWESFFARVGTVVTYLGWGEPSEGVGSFVYEVQSSITKESAQQ